MERKTKAKINQIDISKKRKINHIRLNKINNILERKKLICYGVGKAKLITNEINKLSTAKMSNFIIKNNSLLQELNLNHFIDSRKEYIDSLKKLKKGWIAPGKSEVPSKKILSEAKELLFIYKNWILENKLFDDIKLIMSPVPDGGFGFEIKSKNKDISFLLYNDNRIEIEVCIDDYYEDIDTSNKCYRELFQLTLNKING